MASKLLSSSTTTGICAGKKFASRRNVVVRASSDNNTEVTTAVTRRAMVGLFAGASVLAGKAAPSLAAYGEAANVFGGKTGNFTGFTPYEGDGFSLLIPSKWNPSKEKDFPGTELRYEDNGDAVNNLIITVNPTSKSKISDFGNQDDFLKEISFVLGRTTATFETKSEGGFKANTIAAASILSTNVKKDSNGKEYYMYEILTRTNDGDEGGRHNLIAATVSKGSLYIFKIQAGDKRWFKGAKKDCLGSWESFTVV